MKLLWSKDLKLNTVHVEDVSRACWYLTQWYMDNNIAASGTVPIFNLVDKQDTGKESNLSCVGHNIQTCFITIDQEAINKQLQCIFGIQTGYHGSVVSTFAKVSLFRKRSGGS